MTIAQDDQDFYDEVGEAFGGVHAPEGAQAVVARGRALRRRRRAMPALAAAGVVAVSLGLAAATQNATPSTRPSLAYNGTAVNVDNAAFSVHTNAKTGYITMTLRQLTDPSALEAILEKAGVATDIVVTQLHPSDGATALTASSSGSFSHHRMIPDCRLPAGVKVLPDASYHVILDRTGGSGQTVTFDPSVMPAGSVLGIGYYRLSSSSMILTAVFSGNPRGCLAPDPS